MLTNLSQILTYEVGDNTLGDFLVALAIFILGVLVLKIFEKVVMRKLKKMSRRTKTRLDDLLIKIIATIGWPFYTFISLYLAIQFIRLPQIVEKSIAYIILIILTYYVTKSLQGLIDYTEEKIIEKREKENQGFDPSVINLLSKIFKVILWAIAVIIILQNLGYNISALAAGLGIGGIAIAFALQNILSDIFASFSIYFDRPFQTGDFIVVGSDLGTVKKIGIKSTRIQSLQGEEIVMSNKELTETRVHNYKKMEKRRIVFGFGVEYSTPIERLKKIPQILKEIIAKIKLADIDRVHFKEFGDFSLNYEVVYYLGSSDYNQYMDTQEEINLAIKERFEKEGIEFAYPTQTIFVNKM